MAGPRTCAIRSPYHINAWDTRGRALHGQHGWNKKIQVPRAVGQGSCGSGEEGEAEAS